MKKKLFILLILLVLFAGWSARFYYVNATAEQPREKIYQIGDIVPIENDFINDSSEAMDGYSVKVESAVLKPYADYIAELGESDSFLAPENTPAFVYDVTLTFYNEDNTDTGVNLFYYDLLVSDDRLQIHKDLYPLSCPEAKGALLFSIRPGTEITLRIPYARQIVENSIRDKADHFEKNPLYLVVSYYPVKKLIALH